jgi:hypothetical protein
MQPISENHPLRVLFYQLVGQTFAGPLGLRDARLMQYVADLLTDFVHIDHIYRLKNLKGKRLEEVAEMLMEGSVLLHARSFWREREVHKHIGNFTLFWTGVYPESLRFLRAPTRKDHLIDYVEQGKKSYYIASTFQEAAYRDEWPVLRRLSEEFEVCSFGLGLVRLEWEKLGDPSVRLIMQAFEE